MSRQRRLPAELAEAQQRIDHHAREQGLSFLPVVFEMVDYEQMNALAQQYREQSRPLYCARRGFVDEVVRFEELRRYMVAFAGAAYQDPRSLCPHHHLLLPRLIRSQVVKGRERPKKAR